MGVLHEVLIVIGLVLLLLIGWSFSIMVHETMIEARDAMHVVAPRSTCAHRVCLPGAQPRS